MMAWQMHCIINPKDNPKGTLFFHLHTRALNKLSTLYVTSKALVARACLAVMSEGKSYAP